MKNIFFVLAFTLMIQPVSILAGDDYICKIERISLADGNDGEGYDIYVKNYIGKKFTVLRSKGLMAGSLKNSYLTNPKIIDYGSKKNSYKVVTTMERHKGAGAGTNIYALTILEYKEGLKKPFVFLENDVVYFGSCVHF